MTLAAAAMAAMMLPTALPFFIALRRPGHIAVAAAIYVAVWAAIGAAAYLAMGSVMLPSFAAVIAIALAAAYLSTPWARQARARCRQLCRENSAGAVRAAMSYTGNCVLCSAGVMAALMVVGMTNVAALAVGAMVMLLYKVPMSG